VFRIPRNGLTFVQEGGRVFLTGEPVPPMDIIVIANDEPRFDRVMLEDVHFPPLD
jgi:hypothetical protein